jgi:hypothetical protein
MGTSGSSEDEPTRISMLTYGLIFGPAVGMLVALVLVGSEAIAAGIIIGSGIGVVVGILLDSGRANRGPGKTG